MSLYSNMHGGCVPAYPPGYCNLLPSAGCCQSNCPPIYFCGPSPPPPPPKVSQPYPLVPLELCLPCGGWDYCVSGCDRFECPPEKKRKQWVAHVGTCNWPKPCPANCFDHSENRDWINVKPLMPYGKTKQYNELEQYCRQFGY